MATPDSRSGPIRKTWTAPVCHEDVFIERYQALRGWALRLAGNLTDADDLLHDAFLQFVLRRRDLSEIDCIDAYLHGMLRRLRLSKRRAALRTREHSLDAIAYDTAELSLRATDPRDSQRHFDELCGVCAYGCHRKHTSKSGSVLLLRFFLGFFPGEIARILKCPLRGANDWLRIARREARAYLANPVRAGAEEAAPRPKGGNESAGPSDPLDALRRMIWAARRGECLTAQWLARTYNGGSGTLSCDALAHVVSCRPCLARVTALLGMRDPVDRDPHDVLRQDTSRRFGRTPPTGSGAPMPMQRRRWERELQVLREHVPRELRVAANGLPVGMCSVNAAECVFRLAINLDEPLDFIEVFSEQGVRLLLWEVEPAPAGDPDQTASVEFVGGRSLSVAAHFSAHWPSLEITYRDPEWVGEPDSAIEPVAYAIPEAARSEEPLAPGRPRLRAWLAPIFGPVLRPALAVLALAFAVAIWASVPWRSESVSAAEILADARRVEISAASAPDVAERRVLRLEERRLPDRIVLSRRRIERWHSASRQVTARRVYDDHGRLLAAEWIRDDGTRTLYAIGQAPRVSRADETRNVGHASAWQREPSADDFTQLAGAADTAVVREEDGRYVLTYRAPLPPGHDGLVEATLVVAKDQLRPITQTLVIREHGEMREFYFEEAARQAIAESTIPAAAFQPDTELLPAAPPAVRPTERPIAAPQKPPDPAAIDRLEVDVLFALHRLETCLAAPAEIASSENGTVAIVARASSDACRNRIRQAIGGHRGDGVRALVRFAPPDAAAPVDVTSTSASVDLPAYRTLIARFAAAGLENPQGAATGHDAAAIAAHAFGAWVVEHSRRARAEGSHLDALTTRWSVEALSRLDVDRVARWQDVVRDHARRFRRESEALRLQLGSLLSPSAGPPAAVPPDETIAVRRLEDVHPAVLRLVAMAVAHHEAVRQLFDPALTMPRGVVDVAALVAGLQRAESQAAWFDEPWTLPTHTTAFGIVDPASHISVKAP